MAIRMAVAVALTASACTEAPEASQFGDPGSALLLPDSAASFTIASATEYRVPFTITSMVGWADDSLMIVVDRFEQQVVLLSASGTEQRRFGRMGSGPGEMRGLVQAFASHDGSIAAVDLILNRVAIFSPDGVYEGAIRVTGRPFQVLDWRGDTLLVTLITQSTTGSTFGVGAFSVSGDSLIRLVTALEIDLSLGDPSTNANPVPQPLSATRDDVGGLYFAHPNRYAVVHTSANLTELRSHFVRDTLPPVLLTDEEIDSRREMLQRALGAVASDPKSGPGAQIEADLHRPQPYFGLGSLAALDDGWLVIARPHPSGRGALLDVFVRDSLAGTINYPWRVQGIAGRQRSVAMVVSLDPVAFDAEQALVTFQLLPGRR